MKQTKNESKKVRYHIEYNKEMQPSITKGNRKIGKRVYSFSLLPGSSPITLKDGTVLTNVKGTCNGICSDCQHCCYAVRDAKTYNSTTIPAWGKNTVMLRNDRDGLFNKIDTYISKHKVEIWRWQVAGEIEDYDYLERMNDMALKHPNVQFGVYTKRFAFVKMFINKHQKFADNFCVNLSEWNHNIDQYHFEGLNSFVWDDGDDPEISKLPHCPAVSAPTTPGGKGKSTGITCSQCGRCYRTTGKKTAVYNH